MSTAGITVYNNNGYLQIDSVFKNYRFIAKGTITLGGGNIWQNLTQLSFDENELIAFRPPMSSYFTVIRDNEVSGGQQTVFVSGPPGATLTYYRFSFSGLQGGHYLEIYDENSNLVFSDGNKYFNVVGYRSGIVGSSHYVSLDSILNTTIDTLTVTNAANTAIIPTMPCYTAPTNGIPIMSTSQRFYYSSSTAIGSIMGEVLQQGQTQFLRQYWSYLAVDVTGL